MNTLESPPTPVQPPTAALAAKFRPLHLLRGAALVGLVLVLTFLFGLWLLSRPWMFAVADAISELSGRPNPGPHTSNRVAAAVTVLLLALLPIALVVGAWRFRVRSWWWIGGGWLAVIPVLAYLAADEPSRRTLKLEEMAPAFPGAEQSYAVLMRYGKAHPIPEALALEKTPLKIVWQVPGPKADADAEFEKFITARRADFEADWITLAPQRRWLDELNAFDRIGDLGAAALDTDIVRFYVWRTLSQNAAGKAGLLALDGRGDDAIATLLPVLEASRKLEPSARTLVRFMVARIVQHLCIDVAGFTLKKTPVSPALRARLATALKLGAGGEAGARRLVAIDYAASAGWLENGRLGDIIHSDGKLGASGRFLNLISPFVYNPLRTTNLYGDLIGELQELAARRGGGKISLREDQFWANEGRPRFKNFAGSSVSLMAAPALTKVVDSYWRIEDKRLALLAQLEKP